MPAPGCRCHVCVPEPLDDPRDLKCVSDVLEHGVHVIAVSEGDGPDEPAFAYTVGLVHQAEHPELVMSGQKAALMHAALNEGARRVLAGLRLAPGTTAENVIGRWPVVVDAMSPEGLRTTVRWSAWFHRREVDAVQLVWPDTRGIFAWQPGAADYAAALQPASWRVPVRRTGAVAPDPEWPFPVPPDRLAFACACVADDGAPVRYVIRQHDPQRGEDWQVLCGEVHDESSGSVRLVHLAHLVRGAPSLLEVADLGLDEEAYRESPWEHWTRSPYLED